MENSGLGASSFKELVASAFPDQSWRFGIFLFLSYERCRHHTRLSGRLRISDRRVLWTKGGTEWISSHNNQQKNPRVAASLGCQNFTQIWK